MLYLPETKLMSGEMCAKELGCSPAEEILRFGIDGVLKVCAWLPASFYVKIGRYETTDEPRIFGSGEGTYWKEPFLLQKEDLHFLLRIGRVDVVDIYDPKKGRLIGKVGLLAGGWSSVEVTFQDVIILRPHLNELLKPVKEISRKKTLSDPDGIMIATLTDIVIESKLAENDHQLKLLYEKHLEKRGVMARGIKKSSLEKRIKAGRDEIADNSDRNSKA